MARRGSDPPGTPPAAPGAPLPGASSCTPTRHRQAPLFQLPPSPQLRSVPPGREGGCSLKTRGCRAVSWVGTGNDHKASHPLAPRGHRGSQHRPPPIYCGGIAQAPSRSPPQAPPGPWPSTPHCPLPSVLRAVRSPTSWTEFSLPLLSCSWDSEQPAGTQPGAHRAPPCLPPEEAGPRLPCPRQGLGLWPPGAGRAALAGADGL